MITKTFPSILAALALLAPVVSAEILVKDGETIAFMGDSITQAGNKPNGYISLVIKGFEANRLKDGGKAGAGETAEHDVV